MNFVQSRMVISAEAVKTVNSAPMYNVGTEIAVAENLVAQATVYKYVKASVKLAKYAPCALEQKADGIGAAAPATSTVAKIVGIPQVEIPAGSYGFVAIEGPCVAATGTQAAGDTLEVLNGGTTLVVDGTSGTPVETAGTVAVSAAAPEGGNAKVVLLGKRVTIAAS